MKQSFDELSSDSDAINNEIENRQRADQVSTLISHNVTINGRRTSVRLEKEMWLGLKDIARREACKSMIFAVLLPNASAKKPL